MTRPRTPEIIPDPVVGDRCGLQPCANVHGQPLARGTGITMLTHYKNGKTWIAICPECAQSVASRLASRPIAPPRTQRKRAVVSHGVKQESLL